MAAQPITENTLFYGDNLVILRDYITDASVDLIYLDPPFNSNRNYNVLYKDESGKDSEAQVEAFKDTWRWNYAAEQAFLELVEDAPPHVGKMIAALKDLLGTSQMMAYLVMMAVRLVELHRVLKPTGSLYLHCDATASHYLKVILDTIFGTRNFRNEIAWKRNFTKKGSQYSMTRLADNTDILLFYAKSDKTLFKTPKVRLADSEIEGKYNLTDENGRRFKSEPLELPRMMARHNLVFEFMGYTPQYGWMMNRDKLEELQRLNKIYFTKNGKPRRKNFLDDYEGSEIDNIWLDIPPLGQAQAEALGYPTQKPLALLERIINASSNPGDVILDPFAGCGTAVAAAQKLNRRWIGIDITHLGIALIKYRLEAMFPAIKFDVKREPVDLAGARDLADKDRYQFQWWALSLIRAKPLGGQEGSKTGKKGSDKGIDGVITFVDEKSKPKQALVQVKSGKVSSRDIRDLVGTVQREDAAIGVFITLEEPTADMKREAVSAGFYRSPGWNQNFHRIQILTVDDLVHRRATVQMPQRAVITFKQAQRADQVEASQAGLDLIDLKVATR